jgi:hypothetical protein
MINQSLIILQLLVARCHCSSPSQHTRTASRYRQVDYSTRTEQLHRSPIFHVRWMTTHHPNREDVRSNKSRCLLQHSQSDTTHAVTQSSAFFVSQTMSVPTECLASVSKLIPPPPPAHRAAILVKMKVLRVTLQVANHRCPSPALSTLSQQLGRATPHACFDDKTPRIQHLLTKLYLLPCQTLNFNGFELTCVKTTR